MSSVREISSPEELDSYRLVWHSLLQQTPQASFFQTREWLSLYWKHFGQGQRLRVLVVSSQGQAIGILPLVVRKESNRLGSVNVLTYPLHDWGTFYGPIGPNPTATLLAGLGHLRRTERDWDVIDLRWIDSSIDQGRTFNAMRAKRFAAAESVWSTAAQIQLSGTWQEYWASRTSRWRNNVRRSEKRLKEQGNIEYLRYRPGGWLVGEDDPRWDLYDQCEQLAADSWQGKSTSGTTLSHESIREFLREVHAAAPHLCAADINLLLQDGRPIAFNYAYQFRGYVFGLRTGMSENPNAAGAGTVLQQRMIEDCFTRGDSLYDLGAEYVDCKRYWTNHLQPAHRCIHYSPAARAQLLRFKRWVISDRAGTQKPISVQS